MTEQGQKKIIQIAAYTGTESNVAYVVDFELE